MQDIIRIFEQKRPPEVIKEDPVAVLIIEESGITLFSFKFKTNHIDDQLIGAYFSALTSFGNEVFKGSGTIDQIIFHEFTVLMRKVSEFTFCYVFKGESHSALERLENFIFQIKSTQMIWKNLEESVKAKKKLKVTKVIQSIVSGIFVPLSCIK
ncbi:MAG: hypothetical protein ACFFC6_08575 [Promethearchaeota archaeon]